MCIRVFLASTHPAVRRGIRGLLETVPGMRVVGEVACGDEIVDPVVRLSPDVVLVDIGLPGLMQFSGVRRLHSAYPAARVIILAEYVSPWLLREAITAGAQGYVLEENVGSDLADAIAAVCSGRRYVSSGVPKAEAL